MKKIIYTKNCPEGKNTEGLWLGSFYPIPMHCHTTRSFQLYADVKQRTKPNLTSARKSYEGCTNDFVDFQEFAEFCNTEFGFTMRRSNRFWNLDKDILVKGNKSYSKDTCIFVPNDINTVFLNHQSSRGDYPLGVKLQNTGPNPLLSSYKDNGKNIYCGLFSDPLEAHRPWQQGKVKVLRGLAHREDIQGHFKLINALLERAQLIEDDLLHYRETISF